MTQQQQATHIANDKTPQNLAAGAKNTNADAQKNRLRTLVMGLTPRRGVDPTLANVLTDAVVGVYAEQKSRAVLSRADIAKLIDLESEKQALNCDEDSCLAEIGAAMDVDRIIHGTIDKVGNSYVIAMAEIDARSVETIARVTQKIDADESLAFDTATELAKKLLETPNTGSTMGNTTGNPKDKKKNNPSVNTNTKTEPKDKDKNKNNIAENGPIDDTKKQNPVPDSKIDGKTGALQVAVDTIDAKVFVDGLEKGLAPVIVEKLPAGLHRVTVVRPDHGDLTFDATVFSDGITISTIVVDQLGDLSEVQRTMYADAQRQQRDNLWWKYAGGGVCLAGSACAGIISGIAIGNLDSSGASGVAFNSCLTSIGLFLVGGAGIGWGAYDSVVPVPQPIPDGPRKHVVTVTPPEGQGAPITIQILDTPAPTASNFDETDGKSLPLALPMLH